MIEFLSPSHIVTSRDCIPALFNYSWLCISYTHTALWWLSKGNADEK